MTHKLGRAAQAVYEMVRAGSLAPHMKRFFQRELMALADAGLVGQAEDGRIFDSSRPAAPVAPVATVVRVTLDLPAEVVAMLDACAAGWGATRAQAAERILAGVQRGGSRATDPPTSGTRKATRLPNA